MLDLSKKLDQSRCKGKTKQGKPCRAAATAGGLCFFHSNPNKAAELGRVGGRKNRRVPSNVDMIPALKTAMAVRDVLAKLIFEVYDGSLPARVAAGLVPLLNLQLRAIGQTDMEERIAALEQWRKEENETSQSVHPLVQTERTE